MYMYKTIWSIFSVLPCFAVGGLDLKALWIEWKHVGQLVAQTACGIQRELRIYVYCHHRRAIS